MLGQINSSSIFACCHKVLPKYESYADKLKTNVISAGIFCTPGWSEPETEELLRSEYQI